MVYLANIALGEFPILLAPMEEISDSPFRILCKEMGADVLYTEFISSEGLSRDVEKSLKKRCFEEIERPIGVQIFGNNEQAMTRAAQIAAEVRPDFIDINWGCPVRKIASKGSGSGIMNDIPKMVSISEAVVKSVDLPVTVKTRLGWDEKNKNIVEIALRLQDVGIKALAIHGRTRAQMYTGTADWTLIAETRNHPSIHIPIFGNGDIKSADDALAMKQHFPTDGLMVGRATIGYPWIFREIKAKLAGGAMPDAPSMTERIEVCRRHLKASVELKGDKRAVIEMRKHYSGYFKHIVNFKPYRIELLSLTEYAAVDDFLQCLLDRHLAI
ncbi:MAG: tRNA dihydrouridine synthase DusB [Bacteroidota bacterium]